MLVSFLRTAGLGGNFLVNPNHVESVEVLLDIGGERLATVITLASGRGLQTPMPLDIVLEQLAALTPAAPE